VRAFCLLIAVDFLLFSGELSSCWQHVKSAVNESYPVCPTRLSALSSLVPLLPSHSGALDDNGEAVMQSTAVADLCSVCTQALIGSQCEVSVGNLVISTMLQVLVIVALSKNCLFN